MQTARAHFDGRTILLDDAVNLKIDDKLLVMVLEDKPEELSTSELEEASLFDVADDDSLTKEEIDHYLSLQ